MGRQRENGLDEDPAWAPFFPSLFPTTFFKSLFVPLKNLNDRFIYFTSQFPTQNLGRGKKACRTKFMENNRVGPSLWEWG